MAKNKKPSRRREKMGDQVQIGNTARNGAKSGKGTNDGVLEWMEWHRPKPK
jgi:hypothetical protein